MAKKIKKYKVGLDSETMAISLVSEPAIEVEFIHMSKDEEEKKQVFLESNEKYLIYGPALIPEKDIYRNNGEQEYYLSLLYPQNILQDSMNCVKANVLQTTLL